MTEAGIGKAQVDAVYVVQRLSDPVQVWHGVAGCHEPPCHTFLALWQGGQW